jgi:hypothetical protein
MGISRYIIDTPLAGSPISIEIVYRDGTTAQYEDGRPLHRVILQSAAAVRRLLSETLSGFGEGCMKGDIEVEGDLLRLPALPARFASKRGPLSSFTAFSERTSSFRNRSTLSGSRRNISHHDDMSRPSKRERNALFIPYLL